MNTNTLGNILQTLSPANSGFAIYGSVESEGDFNTNVVFTTPAQKPSWLDVMGGRDVEQWVVIRAQRHGKLQDCDWTQLPDVPLTDAQKTAWETYRQALRDITTQPDPFNINWPTPPE